MKTEEKLPVIGIVGPCTAGKSTLIKHLNESGITARHIAQEHSYVQNMWQRISHPEVLIYLDVSYPVSLIRRNINWTIDEYQEQLRRLGHARQHTNLYLMTDLMNEQEVLEKVMEFLNSYFSPTHP
jgi:deoxyadenosine/deoxycytidine kinase